MSLEEGPEYASSARSEINCGLTPDLIGKALPFSSTTTSMSSTLQDIVTVCYPIHQVL